MLPTQIPKKIKEGGGKAELVAVLDGEIACVDDSGRSLFNDLLFRRKPPAPSPCPN